MGILKWRKHSHRLTRLRSAVGERKQWSGDGETAGTESERNAAAKPQTEARRTCGKSNDARDERTACEAERSSPRVGHDGFTYNRHRMPQSWECRLRVSKLHLLGAQP